MSASLLDLPTELIFEISSIVCSRSQHDYLSLKLVSRRLHDLISVPCLLVVPVILEDHTTIKSFSNFLQTSPWLPVRIRHLWITLGSSRHANYIATVCTNLVSLACSSNVLVFISSDVEFRHTHIRELTLIGENWPSWTPLICSPYGGHLCGQITHLRLQEGVTPILPIVLLTSLTHLAFSTRPVKDFVERHLIYLGQLRNLGCIVLTTFWWREEAPDQETLEILDMDRRLSLIHCEQHWREIDAWNDRVSGSEGIWGQGIKSTSKHLFSPPRVRAFDTLTSYDRKVLFWGSKFQVTFGYVVCVHKLHES
ncbi:hypothetical protein BDQ12DRAFT_682881, partial [Crucibulum laeve]